MTAVLAGMFAVAGWTLALQEGDAWWGGTLCRGTWGRLMNSEAFQQTGPFTTPASAPSEL